MKVEIISRETIRPSSPTPPHLRSFKLSLFDQMTPLMYVPIVFFYPITGNEGRTPTAKRLDQLKKSLSDTLMRYYPLAGRMKDDSSIDCNDEGVDYLEAQVNCELLKVLTEPEMEVLNDFLPCHFLITKPDNIVQLAIQVNTFDCGGLAIGMCILHKIMDASSLSSFVKDWASIARGSSSEAVCPIFTQDSLSPSRDLSGFMPNVGVPKAECSTTTTTTTTRTGRFVFDGSSITALKAKVINNSSSVKHPTRVEAVSMLIWQRIMAASKAKSGFLKKLFVSNHAVNMRWRMVPPLPGNSIGNLVWLASVSSEIDDESELGDLVGQLSEAIRKVDDKCLRELQGDEGCLRFFEAMRKVDQIYSAVDVDSYTFSSWCRFPLYEADFGWGKPGWVSSFNAANSGLSNAVVMMDTRLGDGIEAWMTLDEQVMAILECDKDLLAFAFSNPNALD